MPQHVTLPKMRTAEPDWQPIRWLPTPSQDRPEVSDSNAQLAPQPMTTSQDTNRDEVESQKYHGRHTQGVHDAGGNGYLTNTRLSRDDLLAIAAVAERRRLIRHLHTAAPCDLAEAVRAVGDDPNESHLVHERLKNTHLPLLERFGVVEFDGVVIRPGEEFELAVEFVWDLFDSFEELGVGHDRPGGGEA